MSSKSVLILGIVIIFFLNVLAVHNYVNDHYYSSKVEDKEIKPIVLEKIKKIIKSNKKTKKIDQNLIKYKGLYISNQKQEIQDSKILLKNHPKIVSEKKVVVKENKNIIKKEKEQETEKNELERNSFMTINFDARVKYNIHNPLMKKIAKKVTKNKKIIIEIYQYSLDIQDFLKHIKDDLVEYGVDIDDIGTIYKKDENKKNKIKVLLVKKD